MSRKFLVELKHQKTGKRVRALKKHLAKDYEWKMIERTVALPPPMRAFKIERSSHISIDGVPVLTDIKHVYFIMLIDKKEELTGYLLDNDAGLRKFAEKRYKELENESILSNLQARND